MPSISVDFKYNAHHRHGWGKPAHPQLFAILEANRSRYDALLNEFAQFTDQLLEIEFAEPKDCSQPYWTNRWLPPMDAISIYGMIALTRPEYYIEVGSGNSTKFARRAIRDHGLGTRIISIDPNPRAEIDEICDTVIRKPLQHAELDVFDLPSNTIVFIDGSHRTLQSSDVTVFFTEVLPGLKKGMSVGVHDIFLPNDYPPHWMSRFYSEQYMLACCVLFGQAHFEVIMPVAHVGQTLKKPFPLDRFFNHPELTGEVPRGGAFWLQLRQ